MRILHLQLTGPYTENLTYQENYLTLENKKAGHDVKIITICEAYRDGALVYVNPENYVNKHGIEVVRIPYKKLLPKIFMRKIRSFKNLYAEIEKFSPDIILNHGLPLRDIKIIIRYVKNNSQVRLYADSHEESTNSAQNMISKVLLHSIIYRSYLKKTYQHIEKIFYLSPDCKRFIMKYYRAPEEKLVYWPLGGVLISDSKMLEYRHIVRKELNISKENIMFTHSGKMDKLKKTIELINAFSSVEDDRFSLVIVGSIDESLKTEILALIEKDQRIRYIGWKNGDELIKILCATDVYCQPGSVSATLQNSMCCACAVMIYPHEGYRYFIPTDSAYYVKNQEEIREAFIQLRENPFIIENMRTKAFGIATEMLDYKKIAEMYVDTK